MDVFNRLSGYGHKCMVYSLIPEFELQISSQNDVMAIMRRIASNIIDADVNNSLT